MPCLMRLYFSKKSFTCNRKRSNLIATRIIVNKSAGSNCTILILLYCHAITSNPRRAIVLCFIVFHGKYLLLDHLFV